MCLDFAVDFYMGLLLRKIKRYAPKPYPAYLNGMRRDMTSFLAIHKGDIFWKDIGGLRVQAPMVEA